MPRWAAGAASACSAASTSPPPTSGTPTCSHRKTRTRSASAALILDERWEEALADYQAAAALDPNHPGLASYFAELYLYSGRPGDALDAARAGLEREPGSVMHRVNLAHALLFSGQREAAIAEYETVRDRIAVSEHVNGGAIVLNDLALMREVGLVCDGFDEVEARMREPAGG
jgi:hypothetical protein